MSHRAAMMRRVVEATNSPYPASFDGSTIRFQLALFSLMSLMVLYGMTAAWMIRENWQGRHDSFPSEPLFAIRIIFLLSATTGFIRCAPEVAYMLSYREGSAEVLAMILAVKRWTDAVSFVPGVMWASMIWLYYPRACMAMLRLNRYEGVELALPTTNKRTIVRLALTLVLTFAISMFVAVGKR